MGSPQEYQMEPQQEYQVKSTKHGLLFFNTFDDAIQYIDTDETVVKISFDEKRNFLYMVFAQEI